MLQTIKLENSEPSLLFESIAEHLKCDYNDKIIPLSIKTISIKTVIIARKS
jgi:hypothetical protein